MRFQLRKCSECGEYTLKDECKKCNKKTVLVHPAKFSPDDKSTKVDVEEAMEGHIIEQTQLTGTYAP